MTFRQWVKHQREQLFADQRQTKERRMSPSDAEYQPPRQPGFKDRPGVIRCPCLPAQKIKLYLLQWKNSAHTHTHRPPASQHPRIKTAQCIGLHENTHNAGNHRPIQTDCHAWYTAHSPQPKCAISIWLMSVNRWCFVFLVNKPQSGMHNKASNVICYELSRWNISIGIC